MLFGVLRVERERLFCFYLRSLWSDCEVDGVSGGPWREYKPSNMIVLLEILFTMMSVLGVSCLSIC